MRNRITFLATVLALMLIGYSLLLAGSIGYMSYSGLLEDSMGEPLTGTYDLTFGIWNDSTGGTELWTQSLSGVEVDEGLFAVELGPIDSDVFSRIYGGGRWLEITVGTDPAISPRTRLASVPYAAVAEAVESDGVAIRDEGIAVTSVVDTLDTLAIIVTDASLAGFEMRLYDTASVMKGLIAASPAGLTFEMYGQGLIPEVAFGPDGGSGLDVFLPTGVIDAVEIADEPGLAANRHLPALTLDTAAMQDIVTVDINAPTAGYVLVQGKSVIELSGAAGYAAAWVQIDTASGGTTDNASYAVAGGVRSAPGDTYGTCAVQRIFAVDAGIHTFRLEGQIQPGSTILAQVSANASQLTAVFIPSAYGTVMSSVSSGDIDGPVRDERSLGGRGIPQFQESVGDLREIERRLKEELARVQAALQREGTR